MTTKTNTKGDTCRICGAWVEPGQGVIVPGWDCARGVPISEVEHADQARCKQAQDEAHMHEDARRADIKTRTNVWM